MPVSSSDPEAELQKELQAMFEIDSQEHLQTYFQLAQQLNPASWVADIQNIYRAIHTIKGSAVTVGADAVLQTAMVLEDLLSDLRYLEDAPPLEDGALHRMLSEAGELLGSCLQLSGPNAQTAVLPTVNRIKTLHEKIQLQYLPNWDELTQVHQEFAEQGFDLVILDLEMAINQLGDQSIPAQTLTIAQQMLTQLRQIGQDLQLAEDWSTLLEGATQLTQISLVDLWRQQWPIYFELLKHCAKQSGQLTPEQQEMFSTLTAGLPEKASSVLSSLSDAESALAPPPEIDLGSDISFEDLDVAVDLSFDDLDLDAMTPEISPEPTFSSFSPSESQAADLKPVSLDNIADLDDIADLSDEFLADADDMDFDSLLEFDLGPIDLSENEDLSVGVVDLVDPTATLPGLLPQLESTTTPAPVRTPHPQRGIKIPVPLDRLNQSSQQVVETLLTARSSFNKSSTLQAQLAQLTALTQESAEYISRLRQLQDDYALLRDISDVQDSDSGVSMERYRQGYTTINRLLENILRMSELGAELEGTSQQTVSSLGKLSRNISQLKDGIEMSRLVPFNKLTLRARAILRDLTNRYDKPARLEIKGEQIELDAGVVQQLEPALLHLLRNAYDHGIETMDERLQRGKPIQATIQMTLERRGNLYRLLLQDDGQGIDAQRISQIAQERGFALTQTQTAADLIAVLCQPGFSSRSAVSEVSGRGVGMDVVASQIASIGGQLHLDTQLGQGTTFIIEIPAPQLLVPCVLLNVGERIVALPTDDIRETMMADVTQLQPPQEGELTWQLSMAGGSAPGYGLAAFWHEPTQLSDTAICVRLSLPNHQDVWLIANDLLGQEELLIQPLPHPLVSPPALLGVSLQADGQLLSVLNPIELAQSLATQQPQTSKVQENTTATVSEGIQTILVVDDAALMRRRLESSLNTYGFATFTCSDGQEAWQWLQANGTPDMMITDVEMPNMDGFTLIDRCRQANMEMPILVVSSRLSEEWGKEAERLGANDYLNKGFSTPELINRVKTHLSQQPAEC
ncbi:response regulator [Acaryochloris sp. IP29b_bin.137]|uniref:response regulator n=1 Tax=Acaryochloris sp. IP29b_bin.137 TaxID=2969217 RepID=UPI00260DCC2D|nr:response regulator [Acaryochloris sp. IP29b_bin.137]